MSTVDTLNPDQQQALTDISSFIVGPDKEFLLTGGPGVGKTFLTRRLIVELPKTISNYRQVMGKTVAVEEELYLTSTTNKAAAVLADQTGMLATTLHSFLGVVPKKDFKTGLTKLMKTPQWKVYSNAIIFVDEASMEDTPLYRLLHEATDATCKIIHIGDKNQLAPVMDKISPAVALASDPAKHYELTTPVRNSGSPALMDLCERLKRDVENETPKDQLTFWKDVPDQIVLLNGPEFQQFVTDKFGPGGEVSPNDAVQKARILAYTNRTVVNFNQHIRQLRNLPFYPTVGETLVSNRHVQMGRGKALHVEEEVEIHEVSAPYMHPVDQHNDLKVIDLVITSKFLTKTTVRMPVCIDDFKHLQKHYKKHKAWDMFFHMQESFVDLRDRDASTVYKAQGSTYDYVALVMDDIFASRDPDQLRRMLFVAASRARDTVYVYDKNIHQKPRSIYL